MFEEDLQATQEAVKLLTEPVSALLHKFARPEGRDAMLSTKPRDEDWARVFRAPADAVMRAGYAAMWANPPPLNVPPDRIRIDVFFARSQMFGYANPVAGKFPGGYSRLAPHLIPDRIWVAWRYRAMKQAAGTFFDGLVWLDDRFVWFPKPFRLVGGALAAN